MLKKISVYSLFIIITGSMTACSNNQATKSPKQKIVITTQKKHEVIQNKQDYGKQRIIPVVYEKRRPVFRQIAPRSRSVVQRIDRSFSNKLSNAALGRLKARVRYDGSYHKIAYPWGDVPQNIGVCTDVVIRSYRRLGIDLQQQVHNDMSAAFSAYPNVRKWGLTKPDPNIDHRRVYNLRTFFARRGAALPITHNPRHYKPGDLVTWMVGKDLPHIGIVVNRRSKVDPDRFMIVHNIAYGPQMEDVLFRFPITGHYRYTPGQMGNIPKPMYAAAKRVSRPFASNNRSMNYEQLVIAAQLLGTHKQTQRKKPAPKIKEVSPITVANLSNTEMQQLLQVK